MPVLQNKNKISVIEALYNGKVSSISVKTRLAAWETWKLLSSSFPYTYRIFIRRFDSGLIVGLESYRQFESHGLTKDTLTPDTPLWKVNRKVKDPYSKRRDWYVDSFLFWPFDQGIRPLI